MVTGVVVISDDQLAYPYERLHEDQNCWCQPSSEWVCVCGRTFTSERGLAAHERAKHSEEEE